MSRTVRRVMLMTLGFAVAVAVGFITLFALGIWWALQEAARNPPPDADEFTLFWNQVLGGLAFIATMASALTLLPAVIVAVTGELAKIRSRLYYTLAGAGASAVMPLFMARQDDTFVYAAPHFAIMALAGAAAGLVYWLIAGRDA